MKEVEEGRERSGKGGRQEEEDKGWEEHKAERRWRMYIYILHT